MYLAYQTPIEMKTGFAVFTPRRLIQHVVQCGMANWKPPSVWPVVLNLMAWLVVLVLSNGPSDAQSKHGPKSIANQFLVANETMRDPRFAKTVIYICQHSADGAFGLIINRPFGRIPLSHMLEPFGISKGEYGDPNEEVDTRLGGPVNFDTGFIVHSDDFTSKSAICKHGPVTVTADGEVLRAASKGEGPRRKVIFFGYAGWGPGQLESELAQNAWLTAPVDPHLMFSDNLESVWERVIRSSGIDL